MRLFDDDLYDDLFEEEDPFDNVYDNFWWRSDVVLVTTVLLAFPASAFLTGFQANTAFGWLSYCLILALIGANDPPTRTFFGWSALLCLAGGVLTPVLGLAAFGWFKFLVFFVLAAAALLAGDARTR